MDENRAVSQPQPFTADLDRYWRYSIIIDGSDRLPNLNFFNAIVMFRVIASLIFYFYSIQIISGGQLIKRSSVASKSKVKYKMLAPKLLLLADRSLQTHHSKGI